MEMLEYHKGFGPLYRCKEGSLLRSLSSMLCPKGAGMGPSDAARAILLALQRIRNNDLLRGAPTLSARLRARTKVFQIFAEEIPLGECPLLLTFRVRRNYSARARTSDYFLDFSYLPKFRTATARMLAAWCPSFSAGQESSDALLSEIRTQELSDGPGVSNTLVNKSKARHWCNRNSAPCVAVCLASSQDSKPLGATYRLTDWPDPLPPKPDNETAFQNALRELRRPVSRKAQRRNLE